MKHYLPLIIRGLLSIGVLTFSPHSIAEWTVVGSKGFSSSLGSISSDKVDTFSLTSGKNNKLYVAYTNLGTDGRRLTALEWNGAEWRILGQSDILGNKGNPSPQAYDVDIQADHQDTPFITFGNADRKASVIKWENNDWQFIGTEGFSASKAYHLSLAINTENVPFVAYKDTQNGYKTTMRYWDDPSWQSVGLEGFSDVRISDICTVLDSHDVPYVIQSYKEGSRSNISVMRWDKEASQWVFVGEQDISPSQISKFSCGMDKEDMPYVAYSDADKDDKLTVKYWNNSSWTTLGDAGFTDHAVNGTSIVFDHNNMPYISYQNADDLKAYVMYWNGTTQQWVDSNNGAVSDGQANQVQLAVDHDNRVYLAYRDYTATYQITVKSSEALMPPAPDAPSNLDATSLDENIELTWQDNSRNEIEFKIWRDSVLLTTTAFNKEQYIDTDVTCGTTYQYQILATNAGGDSAAISTSATTALCPEDPTPLPPTDFTAMTISTPSITLNWEDQSHNETAFVLWREGEKVAEIAANQTHFTDIGLACGQSYRYELKAANNSYLSDPIVIHVTAASCASGLLGDNDDSNDSTNTDDTNSQQTTTSEPLIINHQTNTKNTNSVRSVDTQASLGFYILNVASPHSHIVSEPAGIDCHHGEGQCQATFARGTKVDLDFAAPLAAGLVFTGWEGDLDCNDSKLIMNDVKHCFAKVQGIQVNTRTRSQGHLSVSQFSTSLSVGQRDHIGVIGFIFDTDDKQLFAIAGQGIDTQVDPSLEVSELEMTPNTYLQDTVLENSHNIYGSSNAGAVLDLDSGMYLAKIASETTEGQAALHVNPINLTSSTAITNISARGTTQGNGIVTRFSLSGEGTQPILIIGEALEDDVNPTLQLYKDGQVLAQNISWSDNANYAQIQTYRNYPMANMNNAAILLELSAGEYEVHLKSAGVQGQAIVEVDIID